VAGPSQAISIIGNTKINPTLCNAILLNEGLLNKLVMLSSPYNRQLRHETPVSFDSHPS